MLKKNENPTTLNNNNHFFKGKHLEIIFFILNWYSPALLPLFLNNFLKSSTYISSFCKLHKLLYSSSIVLFHMN